MTPAEFEAFYADNRTTLRFHASRLLRTPTEVEDCTQSAWLKIFQHWDQCRGNRRAWAISIVINEAREVGRKAATRPQCAQLPDHLGDREPRVDSQENTIIARLLIAQIWNATSPLNQAAVAEWMNGAMANSHPGKIRAFSGRQEMRRAYQCL
ncbi:MAG TPA: sigma-70 family RNA polymerase sigma factor [Acidobacteriaceae bacterium]|nr:sigma-70 family RNA polymerase sigma factor [Acidobacteriaceae bacterium]